MRYRVILIFILLLGLLLRIHSLSSLPPGPEWDEASVGYNAYSIATTGKDEWGHLLPTIFEAFGDYKNPLYIYSTALFVKFLGLNLFSLRLTAALSGAIAILLIYGIAWELTKKKEIALISAFMTAISPPAIFFSRIAGDGMILSAGLILAGIYFELRSLRTQSLKDALLAHSFLIVSLFAYNLARVLSPILMIAFVGFNFMNPLRKRLPYFIFVTITVAVAGIIIFSQAKVGGASRISYVGIFGSDKSSVLEVNQLRQDEQNSKRSHLLFNKATLYSITLLNNYTEHFGSDFLTSFHNQSVVFESFYPLLTLLFYPLYLYGIYLAIKNFTTEKDKRKKYAYLLLIAWIALSPIPSAITEGAPSAKRYLGSLGSQAILVSMALFSLYEWGQKQGKMIGLFSLTFFFLLCVYLNQTFTYINDFFGPYATTHRTLYAGKENAVGSFVAVHYKDYDAFIYSHQLTGFPYIYPVFDMQMSLAHLWQTRKSYKLDGWNYVSQIDKMYFPDRIDFSSLSEHHYGKTALILNAQEYEDFKKTPLYKNQNEKQLYDDGDAHIYLIPITL